MSQERSSHPAPKRPYEIYGLTEQERQNWRLTTNRFKEILADEKTKIHIINESSNNYGDFLFVTTSRSRDQGRIFMTFSARVRYPLRDGSWSDRQDQGAIPIGAPCY